MEREPIAEKREARLENPRSLAEAESISDSVRAFLRRTLRSLLRRLAAVMTPMKKANYIDSKKSLPIRLNL